MNYSIDPGWRSRFLLTSTTMNVHERMQLARRAGTGGLVRVSRGVYMPREMCAPPGSRRYHRALVHARQLNLLTPSLHSHVSAAAFWRLPRLGLWPGEIHILADVAAGGRSTPNLRRHAEGLTAADVIDGIRVTSLARTVIDIARTERWDVAVVAADAALAIRQFGGAPVKIDHADLIRELDVSSRRGRDMARHVVEFADGRAASPGESLSRIGIARERLTPPELQRRFDDDLGTMYTDFFWPEFGLIGEFDGVGKYLKRQWMDDRSAGQVVVDEKLREDRLRRIVPRVVRWGWDVARNPPALGRLLRAAGLR